MYKDVKKIQLYYSYGKYLKLCTMLCPMELILACGKKVTEMNQTTNESDSFNSAANTAVVKTQEIEKIA